MKNNKKHNDRIQKIIEALQSNKITNFNKIKTMNIDEFAEWLFNTEKTLVEIINEKYDLNIYYDFDLFETIKEWLQAESEQQ